MLMECLWNVPGMLQDVHHNMVFASMAYPDAAVEEFLLLIPLE